MSRLGSVRLTVAMKTSRLGSVRLPVAGKNEQARSDSFSEAGSQSVNSILIYNGYIIVNFTEIFFISVDYNT